MGLPYAALGDSYSAGVGAGGGRGVCFRGPRGYPPLLARELGLDLAYQACLGATVADLLRVQLEVLDADTELVTLTVGGNDAGFVDVIRAAASPAWLADSGAALETANAVIRDVLPGRLRGAYAAVRSAARDAEVVVATYPRLFGGTDCQLLTFFTEEELAALNRTADELAEVIGAAAEDAGVGAVDVRDGFAGHGVCDPAPKVNGLVLPVWESFHPTADGHQEYAVEVAVARPSRPATEAREPRVSYGRDTGASAARFWLPRLDSEQSLAAAGTAGHDREQVRRLGLELRRWWSGGVDEAGVVLDEGDRSAPTPSELAAAAELRDLGA
ncbi:MAG: SGNH/GDSL hydrolase family protein [Nocardioides sp.]